MYIWVLELQQPFCYHEKAHLKTFLRQQKRRFIVCVSCSEAAENTTSSECHRSRVKDQKGLFWYEQGGSLRGGHGDQMVMDVPDSVRQVLDSSMQPSNFYQHHWLLAFCISASVASMGAQASGLLGPLPHLSSFTLQPVHSFFPPLSSHGAQVSKKMVPRVRATEAF